MKSSLLLKKLPTPIISTKNMNNPHQELWHSSEATTTAIWAPICIKILGKCDTYQAWTIGKSKQHCWSKSLITRSTVPKYTWGTFSTGDKPENVLSLIWVLKSKQIVANSGDGVWSGWAKDQGI